MSLGWSPTGTLVIPGRSTSVMFKTLGEKIFSRICFSEIPLFVPSSLSVSACNPRDRKPLRKQHEWTQRFIWLLSANDEHHLTAQTNPLQYEKWHLPKFTWISLRIAPKSVKRRPGICRNSPHSTNSVRSSGLREVCTSCSTRGRRVHISEPLGKKSRPTRASNTLDFPLLWLPTTATCKKKLS